MENLALAHHYGIVHGLYISIFLFIFLFGLSHTSLKHQLHVSKTFYFSALAFAGFGLHAVFFQRHYSAPTTLFLSESIFTFGMFFVPISLMCFNYIVTRATLLQSYRSTKKINTYYWINIALYCLSIAVFIALFFIKDRHLAATLATFLYIPHGIAYIFFSAFIYRDTYVSRIMTLLFVCCTLISVIFLWKFYNRTLTFAQSTMINVQLLLAFIFLVFSFINIRYGYRQVHTLLKIESTKQFRLAADILSSLENDDFYMVYQPKVNIQKNSLDSVEALLRWNHPKHGNIPPADFIDIAEKTGSINSICYWAIDKVVEQNRAWMDSGQPIRTAMNFSAKNLRPEIVDYLLQKMNHHQVAFSNIIIEITEGLLASADERTYQALKMLHKKGIRISLDDYGTGYSSLSRINQLDISELKIDRSFIMNIDTNQENHAIVKATLQMGHELNLKVVAEGMENDNILCILSELKCPVVQGYGIARPMTADKLEVWLKRSIYQSGNFGDTMNIRIPKTLREELDG